MALDSPALDHSIIHHDLHAGAVRIVANEAAEEARAELQMLFPHEAILTTPMGCCHLCVYTHAAPASLVAQRISEHLREIERR